MTDPASPSAHEHVVETPEGARLTLVLAGPVVRSLAWSVDVAIRGAILIAFYAVFPSALVAGGRSGEVVLGLGLLLMFLLSWLYTTLFEALTGTTPGKRLFGLTVVHDNATPVSPSGALVRNLLRGVDSLPFLNLVGLVTMLLDGRFRRLGDLAAGTLVVHGGGRGRRGSRRGKLDAAVAASLLRGVAPQIPPATLDTDARQAIVAFAERAPRLSDERRRELCARLAPLVPDGSDPLATVLGWAQSIRGGEPERAAPRPGARA